MRSIGGSVGTTIYTAILLNYVKGNEVKALTEAVLAAKLPSSSLPIWEFKLCPDYIDKLMPEAIFKGGLRTVVLPILTLFVSGMLYFSLQALWPQQIQLLFTRTPKTIGWYSCVLGATGVLGAFTSGAAFSKIKRTRVLFTTSIVIQTIFIGAMASVTSNTPVRAIIFVAFVGYGIGACQTCTRMDFINKAPSSDVDSTHNCVWECGSTPGSFDQKYNIEPICLR